MRKSVRRLLAGVVGLLILLLAAPPVAASGCAWENCWGCRDSAFGEYCWPVYGEGRLCCNEYTDGETTTCRAFDYYCYGVVVWDIPW